METSRRDRLNSMAEHRSNLKDDQNTYSPGLFPHLPPKLNKYGLIKLKLVFRSYYVD